MPQPTIVPGETTIFKARPSLAVLVLRILVAALATIGLLFLIISAGVGGAIFIIPIFLGGFLTLIFILEWLGTVYLVTSQRIEYRYGIFGFEEDEIALSDVQSVNHGQTFLGILFGYGDIRITSAAKNKNIVFKGIGRPRQRSEQIEDLTVD